MQPIAPDLSEGSHVAAISRRTLKNSGWLIGVCVFAAGSVLAVDPESAVDQPEFPEPIRQNLDFKLSDGQSVHVDNPYGNVYLRFGGYAHELSIHSTLQQPADAAEITLTPKAENGLFVIAPKLPVGKALAATQRLDLVVYVPERHGVRVRCESGDIETRGVKSDLDLKSVGGHIAARGTEGLLLAETGEGSIEVAMAEHAKPGSRQKLATRTGSITVGMTDHLDAVIHAATSAQFATDFSLEITRHDGEEPNKTARAVIGAPARGKREAVLEIKSLRGEIKLLRRAVYIDATPADAANGPATSQSTQ